MMDLLSWDLCCGGIKRKHLHRSKQVKPLNEELFVITVNLANKKKVTGVSKTVCSQMH